MTISLRIIDNPQFFTLPLWINPLEGVECKTMKISYKPKIISKYSLHFGSFPCCEIEQDVRATGFWCACCRKLQKVAPLLKSRWSALPRQDKHYEPVYSVLKYVYLLILWQSTFSQFMAFLSCLFGKLNKGSWIGDCLVARFAESCAHTPWAGCLTCGKEQRRRQAVASQQGSIKQGKMFIIKHFFFSHRTMALNFLLITNFQVLCVVGLGQVPPRGFSVVRRRADLEKKFNYPSTPGITCIWMLIVTSPAGCM